VTLTLKQVEGFWNDSDSDEFKSQFPVFEILASEFKSQNRKIGIPLFGLSFDPRRKFGQTDLRASETYFRII